MTFPTRSRSRFHFHFRTHLLAGALAVLGTFAQAQTAAAPAAANGAGATPHAGHHVDPAKMQERHAQRLAELKQKLQITPAQESAWSSFSGAMRPNFERKRMDREALARMSTPERVDHLRALRQQRATDMDRRGEAAKAFYVTLSTEQQRVFDAETLRMMHGRGKHGRHHG